jgi:hypothetical protein
MIETHKEKIPFEEGFFYCPYVPDIPNIPVGVGKEFIAKTGYKDRQNKNE